MPAKAPRLLVLSDLWGKDDKQWLSHYYDFLSPHFDWKYYESPQLAELKAPNLSQEDRHSFFLKQGIPTAVSNLLQVEPKPVYVLAFSIGGTIAWESAFRGKQVLGLYAISATRLRYKTENPAFPTKLLYGAEDKYRPDHEWFQHKNIEWQILAGKAHEVYKQVDFIDQYKEDILDFFQSR